MSREVCVHSWPCSCYFEPEKRWVPGTLSLTSHSLRFATDQTGEPLLSFPLSSVIEIKKEACPFVFSSITILEKDRVKHWFSSLQPSRNALFSIIEHFWRELLLSPADAPLPLTKGKQLTGLMACSQQRLEETARVLQHQGEQLGSIARGLDKMDSDLDVADRDVFSKKLLWPRLKILLPVFSRILMDSCLIFKSFIHFGIYLSLWYKKMVQFYSLHVAAQFSSTVC